MNKSVKRITILAVLAAMILTACGPSDEELKATAAAETLAVMSIKETVMVDTLLKLTQDAAANPPTATVAPTNTLESAALPTTGAAQASATNPVPAGNDSAGLASETIPDNTIFSSGASFTKTWKFRNTGTTSWTTGYALVFTSGEQMGAKSEVYLPVPVEPGMLVDISVAMKAPTAYGTYQSNWSMRNANGQIIAGSSVWTKIVVGDPLPTATGIPGTATITTTPTITKTLDPNVTFAVTAVSVGTPTPYQSLTCGQTFYLIVEGNITTNKAGTVKYYWKFGETVMNEQSLTFTGAETRRAEVLPDPQNLIANPGATYAATLYITIPNQPSASNYYTVSCQ